MVLYGNISSVQSGLKTSIDAMMLQTKIFEVHNANVTGFDKIGYQRQTPVVSSFAQYLGPDALSVAKEDSPGRIAQSGNPLDFALEKKGYFQYLTPNGIELTRDGRFQLDKYGNLLTLNKDQVLGEDGFPIQLPVVPEDLNDINVDKYGKITIFDKDQNIIRFAGTLSVVSSNGSAVVNPGVRQGYNEYSNVSLQNEFVELFPIFKNFDANRQMYIIHSNNLSKVISEIGK